VFSLLCLALAVSLLAIVVWNVVGWPAIGDERLQEPAAVSVLIPARDESGTIAACLERVIGQGPSLLEVLVYDDRSADGTGAIVDTWRARDPRVRLVRGGDLPAGWFGKPHACMRLAEQARGEWLLFLDADARLQPRALDRLVQEARRRRLTLLSPWPALMMLSRWEQLLMPVLNLVVLSLYPAPLSLLRQDPSLGLAHGACILARRDTYFRLGGHAMVRTELFEDSRLAQRWRGQGERALCLDGQHLVSVRMYSTLLEIRRGFEKNLYPAFEREASFWSFLGLHVLVFVAPVLMLIAAPSVAAGLALGAGVLMRLLLALRFGHPIWSVWLQPMATCVMVGIALASRRRYRHGGVEWKGRRYTRDGAAA
jgi:chlorobactene glucosyltransferase